MKIFIPNLLKKQEPSTSSSIHPSALTSSVSFSAATPKIMMETESVWKVLKDPSSLDVCDSRDETVAIQSSSLPMGVAPLLLFLCAAIAAALWQWRRRCSPSRSTSQPTFAHKNHTPAAAPVHPIQYQKRMMSYRSIDGTSDTDSTSSSSASSSDDDHHHHHHVDLLLPQSGSMFGGQFQDEDLEEFEAFENEPLQEIIADTAHNDHDRTRLLQIEEQTRHLLLALGSMFQTSVEENRHSVHWMVHQEMQSRDERLTHHELQQQALVANLSQQVQQLQLELQQGLERFSSSSSSTVLPQQGTVLQGLLEQVSRLEQELQQERRILDKAVLATHDTTHLAKDIAALVQRVHAFELSKKGGVESSSSSSTSMSSLEQRVQQLEQDLKQQAEKNGAETVSRDLLFQKALADLTDQVEELEEKLDETIDANDATTSILETRLHLQAKAQELAVQNLESKVDIVAEQVTRVDQETKASISQVQKDQQEQGVVFNSKLQALQDQLNSCQEEWKTVLQGLQSWDEKLASYRLSQEKATEHLSQQLVGLQGELQQARKQTEENQQAIKAAEAASEAAVQQQQQQQQDSGIVKKRLQFWRNPSTTKSSKNKGSSLKVVVEEDAATFMSEPSITSSNETREAVPTAQQRIVMTAEGCEMEGVETLAVV